MNRENKRKLFDYIGGGLITVAYVQCQLVIETIVQNSSVAEKFSMYEIYKKKKSMVFKLDQI